MLPVAASSASEPVVFVWMVASALLAVVSADFDAVDITALEAGAICSVRLRDDVLRSRRGRQLVGASVELLSFCRAAEKQQQNWKSDDGSFHKEWDAPAGVAVNRYNIRLSEM